MANEASVKIDFMVPGFGKCGTTSICAALAQHPDVFIPSVKEPRYFSSAEFEKRQRFYDSLYEPALVGQKKGDGSPSYSAANNAEVTIPRILANNPDCRFIFIARHPRQRIESFYREMHNSAARWGVPPPPFAMHAFMQEHPDSYENAMFFDRISRFIEAFGHDAVLAILLEDFHADNSAVTKQCCVHIGVDPERLPLQGSVELNRGTAKLHDTQLLRTLRGFGPFQRAIARMPYEEQNKLLGSLRLRLPFGKKPIVWDEPAEQLYQEEVVPQARNFLALCGKPADFWEL